MLEQIGRALQGKLAEGDAKVVKYLSDLSVAELDTQLFRAKPRHPTWKAGRPWVWAVMLQEEKAPEFTRALRACCSIKCEDLFITAQYTLDGPLLK
eukprot:3126104-Pyramimonas_sp.AAC.1